ncbi:MULTISPECIES: SoxR reducing system RseC family protein [unclassified Vibrio]|uniref:SoxR reducing system RseC family protein n=1 Tax=Vibrio sp. HB236076 TaxID=3232307 RepID=A0AB39HDN2_9VIBR|nr:SoxR reducing system RseC family protein [Vibrio sp. HB161653]MDP5253951.1 SoxR reducing system RseC family protein [Vibrio sp. HB161653]
MMTALARVQEVKETEQGWWVELACQQQSSCNSCQSQKSCGTGMVSKAIGNKTLIWQLNTSLSVKHGDVVEIGIGEKSVLSSALLVYLTPLLFMMVAAVLSQWWLAPLMGTGEGLTILISALSGFVGMKIAQKLARPFESHSNSEVSLIRVLGQQIV